MILFFLWFEIIISFQAAVLGILKNLDSRTAMDFSEPTITKSTCLID